MIGPARLRIVAAGPSTSIQDAGRVGARRFGVPRSGPLDEWAYSVANAAVGNAPGAPAVEVGPGGLTVEVLDAPVTIAVAGGGFDVTVEGEGRAPWSVSTVSAGGRVAVSAGEWGSWCVVAVAGDLVVDRWLHSAATHVASGLGGGVVAVGEELVVDAPRAEADRDGPLPVDATARPPDVVRAVAGPQEHRFAPGSRERLTSSTFRVSGASDRMGTRLVGPVFELADALSIPSEPITSGSLQVSGDGVATIQLADHLTIGGYPKLATVIGADLGRVAQLRPGDEFVVELVDPPTAVAAARERSRSLAAAASRAGRTDRTLDQRLRAANLVGGVVSGRETEPEGDDDA